jgi:adenylate kinase family enzyme
MLTTSSIPPLPSEGASQTGAAAAPEQPHGREITAHVDDAGFCAAERFIAVVGPPAVGKSPVTRTLADHLDAQVFRLREFAHEFRSHGTVDERLFDTRDSLDWFSEETVFLLLQAAFIQGQFQTCGLVVLENFPGSLTQLLLLKATADQLRAPLMLIELTADNIVVAARARTRRVCPTCEPDQCGDPHRPARPATHDLDRCDRCGGGLQPRRDDEPHRFAARLARFRRRIPAIRRAAMALQMPYHAADATCDPDTCLQSVVTALAATEPQAHLLGSRHECF